MARVDTPSAGSAFAERVARARSRMSELDVDVLLLSVGADLPWLTGYEAMPLERLTMLVLPRDGDATLLVPRLEAPRVEERPDVFAILPWDETDDPVGMVAKLAAGAGAIAIGDRTWARFLVDLHALLPGVTWRKGSDVTAPLRARKDAAEISALRAASAAADRVAAQLQGGEIPLVGRTEREVSRDLGRRLVAEGHARVNFAIVAAGEHAASPHHEPGERVIDAGEMVLCDFGGTMPDGYCSDITRCVWTGGDVPSRVRDLYAVLQDAQARAVEAAVVGTPCEDVDGVARRLITDGGYGPHFIHRTGHGIGLEEHEDPYLVGGNCEPLAPGHAFSIEPGIYLAGDVGARIEDIVVATEAGPEPLNHVTHDLVVVER
ncbi:MAG TPA: Xaa-Pro peptidase family protein [Acidimicrobiales bacterium]|nr:Xaa-Pro peptidase family protein [Acidimicrobiales bacterium]